MFAYAHAAAICIEVPFRVHGKREDVIHQALLLLLGPVLLAHFDVATQRKFCSNKVLLVYSNQKSKGCWWNVL